MRGFIQREGISLKNRPMYLMPRILKQQQHYSGAQDSQGHMKIASHKGRLKLSNARIRLSLYTGVKVKFPCSTVHNVHPMYGNASCVYTACNGDLGVKIILLATPLLKTDSVQNVESLPVLVGQLGSRAGNGYDGTVDGIGISSLQHVTPHNHHWVSCPRKLLERRENVSIGELQWFELCSSVLLRSRLCV